MTGGSAVILGEIGLNFAAGMTGGMAYIYDPEGHSAARINTDTVLYQRLASAHWERELLRLITAHYRETDSPRADSILAGWEWEKQYFWQVCPLEMVNRLEHPLRFDATATTRKKA